MSVLKKNWLEIAFEPVRWIPRFYVTFITDSSGDDGVGSNSDARRTNKAGSSHSKDTIGNSGTDNNIHMGNIRNSLGLQTQLKSKLERRNAARERKPVPLPPIQLREVFSLFSSY